MVFHIPTYICFKNTRNKKIVNFMYYNELVIGWDIMNMTQ